MSAMQTPFSLRIFVADGDPDGLRIVDKSNWIGKALVFPRALLPQVKVRPELAQTGVFLLLDPRHRLYHHHGRLKSQSLTPSLLLF